MTELQPEDGAQRYPFTPLSHLPWLNWLDRTGLPAPLLGLLIFAVFIPFYQFTGMTPQLPLQGGGFPPVLALSLAFLLQLSRGASADLRQLIVAGKLSTDALISLAASVRMARIELFAGLLIGIERVYSQIVFDQATLQSLLQPATLIVCLSIIAYTVVQIHLLGFCIRQVVTFRRAAQHYQVDLRAPELNNVLSNPLIRFIAVGLIAMSFILVLYEAIPYASLQRRVLAASAIAMLFWLVLILVSLIPLFVLRGRIRIAKSMEINLIRQALNGKLQDARLSQFGERLKDFSPGELMYYEDRINMIWDWPVEAQIRRLVIFGLLPPLTWVMAAAVEVIFDSFLTGG